MPWAMDMAVFDMASTKGGTHVRTKIVNRVNAALMVEHSDDFGSCIHHLAGTLGQFSDLAKCDSIGHDYPG